MASAIKNIIILGGLIAVAVAGYYMVVVNGQSTLEQSAAATAANRENQIFLQRLGVLRSVDLTTEIFSDDRLRSLVDFSSNIEPVSYGRENPFLPKQ